MNENKFGITTSALSQLDQSINIQKKFNIEMKDAMNAISKNTPYIASDPNLINEIQKIDPSFKAKRVVVPDAFFAMLLDICKGDKAKKRFFDKKGPAITIAQSVKKDMDSIFNAANKYNYNHIAAMYTKYLDTLIARWHFPNPTQYESCNIIDGTKFYQAIFGNSEESCEVLLTIYEYLTGNTMFASLPCFTEGVLIMAPSFYCHWKVEKLDIDNHTLIIGCYMYQKDIGPYTPYALFKVTLEFPEIINDGCHYKITHAQYWSLDEMLHSISPKQMKWPINDRKAWNSVVMKFANMVDASSEQGDVMSEFIYETTNHIFLLFTYVNSILHANKKKYKPRKNKPGETKVEKSFNPEKQNEKKLHILNSFITITSDRPPEEMTRRRAVKYYLASWSVKGHVRHYKSGKVAYVKPHDAHRKGMEKEAASTTPRAQHIVITGE